MIPIIIFRWNVLLPMMITDGSISVKKRTEWPLMLYNMPAPSDRPINCCHFCASKETAWRAWAALTKTQWWVKNWNNLINRTICGWVFFHFTDQCDNYLPKYWVCFEFHLKVERLIFIFCSKKLLSQLRLSKWLPISYPLLSYNI